MLDDRRYWPRHNNPIALVSRRHGTAVSNDLHSNDEYMCTSASPAGLFVHGKRQAVLGDTMRLSLLEHGHDSEPVVEGSVVRVVPTNKHREFRAGVGIRLERLISLRGAKDAVRTWETLFQTEWRGPLTHQGPIEIELPTSTMKRYTPPATAAAATPALVFVKNMVLKGQLDSFHNGRAVLKGMRLPLSAGSHVRVQRMSDASTATTNCVVDSVAPSNDGFSIYLQQRWR